MAYYKKKKSYWKRGGWFGGRRKKKHSAAQTKAFHIGFGAGLVRAGQKDQLNNYLKGSNSRSYVAGMKSAEHVKAFNFDDFMF